MEKKTDFKIPFTRESIILSEPELKGYYVEQKMGVIYEGYSLIQIQEVTPFIMESLLKRVYHLLVHLQEFWGETQWDITRDLIYQVSLLIYAQFKNGDINKEEATKYSEELLGYAKTFNSISKDKDRGWLVVYHPEYTQPESIEYFDNVLSMYDYYLNIPEDDGEEELVPISVILKREESLTNKLITIFNYHYDRILQELWIECQRCSVPEDGEAIREFFEGYMEKKMGFPPEHFEDFMKTFGGEPSSQKVKG